MLPQVTLYYTSLTCMHSKFVWYVFLFSLKKNWYTNLTRLNPKSYYGQYSPSSFLSSPDFLIIGCFSCNTRARPKKKKTKKKLIIPDEEIKVETAEVNLTWACLNHMTTAALKLSTKTWYVGGAGTQKYMLAKRLGPHHAKYPWNDREHIILLTATFASLFYFWFSCSDSCF